MTTSVDNLKQREEGLGEGRELTEGIPQEGFSDPTGEYPKQDYFFSNSVNKAAKGEKINNLRMGGGDYGVDIDLPTQRASQFPHNQVQESQSGHVIEVDDTPGGERILIKHRTGAGLELRADGSVLFSTLNKKVEITGGDQTVIVEGEGNLIYKGNLNVRVTGDYNLQVDGNINVTTAGDKTEKVHGNHTKTVDKNQNYVVKGDRGAQVVGSNGETVLGNNNLLTKGFLNNYVEGDIEMTTGGKLITTALTEWVATAQVTNISGAHVSVMGLTGTIGGMMVDHFGKCYSGPPEGLGNGGTTFMGTLVGRAAEANVADYANSSAYAFDAGNHSAGTSYAPLPGIVKPPVFPFVPIPLTAPMPNAMVVMGHITSGNYAIRNVQVDTDISDPNSLKAKLLKTDDYSDLFNRDPNIHEVRSKLRDPANLKNTKFTGQLVAEGVLSSSYANTAPPAKGRTVGKNPALRYGLTPLGSNPSDNRSKRFIP